MNETKWEDVREGIEKFASEAGVAQENTSGFVDLVQHQIVSGAIAHRVGAGQDLVKGASVEELSELDKLLIKTAGEITNEGLEKLAKEGLLQQILAGLQSAGGQVGEALQTPYGRAGAGAAAGGAGSAALAKILGLPMAPSIGAGMGLGGVAGLSPEILAMLQGAKEPEMVQNPDAVPDPNIPTVGLDELPSPGDKSGITPEKLEEMKREAELAGDLS